MNYIRHITLTTGHARDSFPGEVSDEARSRVRDLLIGALERERPVIPGVSNGEQRYWLTAGAAGDALHACVWAPPPDEIRERWNSGVPLVTIGVALRSRSGAGLWRRMHEAREPDVVTSADEPPPAPWCAARIEVGIAWYQAAAEWLGDFERCAAWAWHGMRGQS